MDDIQPTRVARVNAPHQMLMFPLRGVRVFCIDTKHNEHASKDYQSTQEGDILMALELTENPPVCLLVKDCS